MSDQSKCGGRHKGCPSRIQVNAKRGSWLSALLIMILPKCPFCVMAYSGAMSLCSGKMLYPNAGSDSIIFIAALALLILAGIIFNYKGRKTLYSTLIALVGISILLISQLYWYSEAAYYLSVIIIILAIWNNGSLHHILKYLENLVYKQNNKVQT